MARDSIRSDLVVGTVIARAEVRDRFRRHTSSRREKALYGLIALFAIPGLFFFLQQAHTVGVLTRDGVDTPVVAIARNFLVPMLLVMSVIAGLEAVQQLGGESSRALLLTSASTRAIVVGKVLSLLVSWLILVGLGFLLVVAYSIGARTPLFVFAAITATIPVFLLVLVSGLSLGYLLWVGIERLGLSEGSRQLLTATLYILVFAGMFAGGNLLGQGTSNNGLAGIFPTGNPITPLGWYADLFFIGSPMETELGFQTLGALMLVLGAIPVGFAILVRLAPLFWYATPTDDSPSESAESGNRISGTPSQSIGRSGGLLGRSQTLRIARGYVRSGSRNPGQFVYLFYYLFPIAPVLVQQGLGNPGFFPTVVGASLLLLGVWLAGGVFCLNPLGSEGAMLSQLVLGDAPAERFTHARLLLGTVLGLGLVLPGVLLLIATTEVVSPVLGGFGGIFLTGTVVASASFALGIGSVLPKFEAVEIFESVETLAPSIIAALIHVVVSSLLLVSAIVATVAAGWPDSPLSIAERVGVTVLFVFVVGVLADGSRRYAIARFRDYGCSTVRTDPPFAIYASLGLAVLALVLGQSIAVTAVFLLGVDLPLTVLLPALFLIEYLGYVIVAVGFLYVSHRGWAYLDLSFPSWREGGYVVGGVLASLAIWASASLLVTELGLPAADHTLFDSGDDGTATLLLLLIPLMLLINGPVEELFFRNVIQKYIAERFSQLTAIGIASAIFAIAHVPAYLTAGLGPLLVTLGLLFVISTLWGVIYAKTESLFVVAAIHGIYNAILVGGLYLTLA